MKFRMLERRYRARGTVINTPSEISSLKLRRAKSRELVERATVLTEKLAADAMALENEPTVEQFIDVAQQLFFLRRWGTEALEWFKLSDASREHCEKLAAAFGGLTELEQKLEHFGRLHFLEADGEA